MADKAPVEVLIVEDNASAVELIMRAMKKNKLIGAIRVARDGQEALDLVFARGTYADRISKPVPRLIVLDLGLPKVDGLEVLKQLRSDERTKSIPVMILTASQAERDRVEGYKLNVERYIIKPGDFAQLETIFSEMSIHWLLYGELP